MPRLVKLRFFSPLHLGEAGLGLEESSLILYSDTLYSCLFQVWLRLFNEPLPEMRLSSAYPYIGETLYFPRPLLPAPGYNSDLALVYGKALKRVRFIACEHFTRWLKALPLDFEKMLEESSLLHETMGTRNRPQIALDRRTADSSLYFVGETYFDKNRNAGLFFLVDLPEENWSRIKMALNFLGEEGIGGRRSRGYGVFEPHFVDDFYLDEITQPDAYLTLSLVYPASTVEVRDNLIAYQLIERTGWLEDSWGNHGMRHQRLLMFAEGSVFRKAPRGRIVNVTPPGFDSHPVYRNGIAFNVGVKLEAGQNEKL